MFSCHLHIRIPLVLGEASICITTWCDSGQGWICMCFKSSQEWNLVDVLSQVDNRVGRGMGAGCFCWEGFLWTWGPVWGLPLPCGYGWGFMGLRVRKRNEILCAKNCATNLFCNDFDYYYLLLLFLLIFHLLFLPLPLFEKVSQSLWICQIVLEIFTFFSTYFLAPALLVLSIFSYCLWTWGSKGISS